MSVSVIPGAILGVTFTFGLAVWLFFTIKSRQWLKEGLNQ